VTRAESGEEELAAISVCARSSSRSLSVIADRSLSSAVNRSLSAPIVRGMSSGLVMVLCLSAQETLHRDPVLDHLCGKGANLTRDQERDETS
jgi:hypothetical protein